MINEMPLNKLSIMVGKNGLLDPKIPTTMQNAEDVVGMQGRIRLQKDEKINTSQWMDKQRSNLLAYEYLCHIGEAKEWIEGCLGNEIDSIIQLEETMRNGIVLAKLANWFAPGTARKIFQGSKLQFRHSDNINYFFDALKVAELPQIFWFELTDLYEKKNIPKVIYCIHALSHLLARRNMAPNIKNLLGQLQFTNEELNNTQRHLDMIGLPMPNFMNLSCSLLQELDEKVDEKSNYLQTIPASFDLKTPELVIEEGDESDLDSIIETSPEEESKRYWSEEVDKVIDCQRIARHWLLKKENERKQQQNSKSLELNMLITQVQSKIRRILGQRELHKRRRELTSYSLEFIIHLQAHCRGYIRRLKTQRMFDYYRSRIDQVIQIQTFIKNKLVTNAYRRLITDLAPSACTVKNFVHLLDDSDLDFDRELELEALRQNVIEHLRENNRLESNVTALDIQIALFLKNIITIDEVLKHAGKFNKKKKEQKWIMMESHEMNPFALSGVDKESRQRLDLFRQLIYVLQTEPQYVARLLCMTRRQDLGLHSNHRLVVTTVLSLFGYATNAREEYLLINLCKQCISEEIQYVETPQEFMCGNYTFMKLVVQANRGTKERQFFRELFGDLIKGVIQSDHLDLDLDIVSIYQKIVNDEESRTGKPSERPYAVTAKDAQSDSNATQTFAQHLKSLKDITEAFFNKITATVDAVPYGIRMVAKELKHSLEEKFADEPKENVVKILGNFIYYRYLNPALVAPEQYDVIDGIISPAQRKNLAEVSKMLQRIASGSAFSDQDKLLSPLNEYISHSSKRFANWFITLANVQDPETHYNMDAFTDQLCPIRPVVYLSPSEVFHLHYTLQNNLDIIEPEGFGILSELVYDLGQSAYHPDIVFPETTVCLSLSSPYKDLPTDHEAQLRHLLVDAKRLVVYVLKIQSGPNLARIFDQPITAHHERAWNQFKCKEFSNVEQNETSAAAKRRYLKLGQNNRIVDLRSLSFFQLKSLSHRLVTNLKIDKKISADNTYQDVITYIARDIIGKNSRRTQRDQEIERINQTLSHLKEKREYLVDQGNQYEGYLTSCMQAMAQKCGKKKSKFVLPFTRQYFHMRGLERLGLVPKFGSYKYTAKQLLDRHILLEVMEISKKHYDRIPIILSMDQADIITIEASYEHWPMSSMQMDIRYEELLRTQFEGAQTMTVLNGMAKVNVNLLIYLVNKKFYN